MAFENLRTIFFGRKKLGHVTFAIAYFCQPFCAFEYVFAFHLRLELGGPLFKNIIKKLFRRVRAVDVANRSEQLESKLIAVDRKKIVTASGQPINHFRPAHFLRTPPSVEIAVSLESDTMLFDPLVSHP